MGMGGSGSGDEVMMTRVRVSKKEVVAAVLPMQEHWLPLSNLDLLLPPVDVGVFFCYKKPPPPPPINDALTNTCTSTSATTFFGSMVSVLKKALSQALVTYYAFGGEVVPNSVGEPELLCNNRGVDFVEAFCDVELQHLDFYNPDLTFDANLVPHKKQGVLTVQATELKCGGMVVACTFDHRVADAFSANMFLVSWAEMARSKPISTVPTFRRSLLNPRRPPPAATCIVNPSIDDMYVPISTLPPPKQLQSAEQEAGRPSNNIIISSRIYYITAEQLNDLQSLANCCSNNNNNNNNVIQIKKRRMRSKLESFSAFLWKMVAQYYYYKKSNSNLLVAKMGIVVDGRSRLKLNEGMMGSYFGNVLSIPFGWKTVEELSEKPLSWVADEVHAFLEGAATEEHFLSLIDWVEARRPYPALAKIYAHSQGQQGEDTAAAFVVSSGQRFPESEVDFGWGRPAFGSYHFPWGGSAGYVMPMPSPLGNGDWVVYMHLFKPHLDFIETQAAHVFRPLTWDYLSTPTPTPTPTPAPAAA